MLKILSRKNENEFTITRTTLNLHNIPKRSQILINNPLCLIIYDLLKLALLKIFNSLCIDNSHKDGNELDAKREHNQIIYHQF